MWVHRWWHRTPLALWAAGKSWRYRVGLGRGSQRPLLGPRGCRRLTALRHIELKHLKVLHDDVHIGLEALHGIEGTGLADLCCVIGLLDVRKDVGLSLDLVGEQTESLCVEADELDLVHRQ